MPLYAREEPPVIVPPGVSDSAFYAAILDAAKEKVEEWQIPPAPPEWLWRCFFLAARAMVAQRARGRGNLLRLWDLRAAQFAWACLNAPEEWEPENQVSSEALKDLFQIMLNAEAVKEGTKRWPIVEIFDKAKAAFKHCRELRNDLGSRGKYELMADEWPVPVPKKPMPTDSIEFYRLALRQVFGTRERPRVSFMGEPFSADMIKDHQLEECCRLFWKRPGEAARHLVAGLTSTSPAWVAQVISQQRRARPAPRGYIP